MPYIASLCHGPLKGFASQLDRFGISHLINMAVHAIVEKVICISKISSTQHELRADAARYGHAITRAFRAHGSLGSRTAVRFVSIDKHVRFDMNACVSCKLFLVHSFSDVLSVRMEYTCSLPPMDHNNTWDVHIKCCSPYIGLHSCQHTHNIATINLTAQLKFNCIWFEHLHRLQPERHEIYNSQYYSKRQIEDR